MKTVHTEKERRDIFTISDVKHILCDYMQILPEDARIVVISADNTVVKADSIVLKSIKEEYYPF